MAEVTLSIGGRTYDVHCGDGEETHLLRLAAMIDDKAKVARKASPGLTEVRQLLFAGILLADEIHDLRVQLGTQRSFAWPSDDTDAATGTGAGTGTDGEDIVAARLNALAARIEALAEKLAGAGPAS